MPATDEPTEPDLDDDAALPATGRYGRYEVIRRLGAGGMGIVLEARDPALNRNVALKLLRPQRNQGDGAARLAFEAKAMARLAHPNVVAVFEIDRVGDQAYVAMELVAGTTLRGWLRARPRRWREILATFVAAGRGLAAAHAAGLVHRDFKPDNVLVGSDGRPRVSDFGLVLERAPDDSLDGSLDVSGALDAESTFRGSAVGTPAYMSPEQWGGQHVDARSDQFAFCVALWEALCDRRPFPGSRPHDLRLAVRSGALPDPPRERRAPRWLLAMVRRGLALDPAARWPDMTTLLDAIERRVRSGRRRTVAAITAGIAVAAAAIAAVVAHGNAVDPCAWPEARLAAVWSAPRAAGLGVQLAAADPAHGADRFARIAGQLGAGTAAWGAMAVEACRATRVEGRQSDTLLDLRAACLDRALLELGAIVGVVGQARDPEAVDRAVRLATTLPALDACADAGALAGAPPPAGAADRIVAVALAARTRALDVARRAGRLDGLAAETQALVAQARTLDHAPTLAAALALEARVQGALGDEGAAEPALRDLVQVAARAHDDRDEAFAWLDLVMITGYAKGKLDDALALVPAARAAVLRAGEPLDLRVDLRYDQAIALGAGGRQAEALALLQDARGLLERAGATGVLAARLADVLLETGTAQARLGDNAAAATSIRAAIARWRELFGPDSPDEAFGWNNLAVALHRAGKLDEALEAIGHAVQIRSARLGDSPTLALSLVEQAGLYDAQRHWDRSLPIYDRALRIDRAVLADDLGRVAALMSRSLALGHLGRFDEAQRDVDEAIARFDRAGNKTINLPIAVYNRGDLAARRDRCADAIADHARAATLFEELGGPTSNELLYPLAGEGECLVRLGRFADAIPVLERALRCGAHGGDAFELARAQAYLGRARVETRRDVPGGLALARAARAGLAASADGADELRMLDRWLAGHAG